MIGHAAAQPGAGKTQYPLTVENCGHRVSITAAPQRAVTLNQSAAEILIRLGLDDRLVGTGYEVDALPTDIAETYARVPKLTARGGTVAHEKLLEAQPDFVYSSFASFLTADAAGERSELERLGIGTYHKALIEGRLGNEASEFEQDICTLL